MEIGNYSMWGIEQVNKVYLVYSQSAVTQVTGKGCVVLDRTLTHSFRRSRKFAITLHKPFHALLRYYTQLSEYQLWKKKNQNSQNIYVCIPTLTVKDFLFRNEVFEHDKKESFRKFWKLCLRNLKSGQFRAKTISPVRKNKITKVQK